MDNRRSPSVDKYDEAFTYLLNAIVQDLKNGMDIKNSGIRLISDVPLNEYDIKYLMGKKLIRECGNGTIRIPINESATRQHLKKYELKLKQIDYFNSNNDFIEEEERRVQTFHNIADYIVERIIEDPEIIPGLVALGIQEMLDSSEMTIPLNRVLAEGLSPNLWFKESAKAIPVLSMDFSMKCSPRNAIITGVERVKQSRMIDSVPDYKINTDVDVIRRVLQINLIIDGLSSDDIKLLGIYWFLFKIMREELLLPPYEDNSILTMMDVRSIIQKIMKTDIDAVASHIEAVVCELIANDIIWASNIVRLPEVI